MKYIKMLGLAAVAAMAVMAFIGASSASANVLCKENASPCANDWKVGETIKATAVNPVLTSEPEVTCEHSEVEIKVTNTGGASNATGEVTKLTFTGNCETDSGIGCDVSSVGTPFHAEVTGTGSKASLTVKNGAAEVSCFFGILDCTFGKSLLHLSIKSGNPATVAASNEELEIEEGGGSCPEQAFWDADYKTTNGGVWVV